MFKMQTAPKPVSQPVFGAEILGNDHTDWSSGIADALIALAEGQPMTLAPKAPEDVQRAFANLASVLEMRDKSALARTTDFSMQASSAMASVSRLTGEVRKIDDGAQNMSSAIVQLNASVSQISDSTQQTTELTSENARVSSESASASKDARASMENISDTVSSLSSRIEELRAASLAIGDIVATIDAIASQTNLLALNATIEAARAGEAGKGFAVVASEVKNLSGQTSRATEDIRLRIEGLQKEVSTILTSVSTCSEAVVQGQESASRASDLAETSQDLVQEIRSRVDAIAQVLAEQTEASQELAKEVTGIADSSKIAAERTDQVIEAVAQSEKLIGEGFAELDQRKIPNYVLYRAKSDHFLWKKNLSEMLVGRNNLTARELSDHKSCRLGKWYQSVKDPSIQTSENFRRLDEPHARVHTHGKAAASAFASGDVKQAEIEIDLMEKASDEVVALLDRLIHSAS